jgi:ProP effector
MSVDIKAAIGTLCKAFPMLFVAERWMPHKPLKIGVHNDIIAAGILHPHEIRAAIGYYRGRLQYQRALAAGGPRYDLDGNVAGEVTADQVALWLR